MYWKLGAQSLGGGEELGYDQETYSSALDSVIVGYFTTGPETVEAKQSWSPNSRTVWQD